MKIIHSLPLIIIFLVINLSGYAQYDPMVVENKLWSEVYYGYNFSGGLDAMTTTYYKFQGDTNIGGNWYKILLSNYGDSLMRNWNIEAFFREDSMRVFENSQGEEFLRFDFSMKKGDSICISEPVGQCNYYISPDSVDTIELEGVRRKRIMFGSDQEETWIEGLGSLNKPFEPFALEVDRGFDLLCCQQNGMLLYKNVQFKECFVQYFSNIKDPAKDKIRKLIINPNPLKNYALISISGVYQINTVKVSIVSRNGQVVREFTPRNIPFRLETGDLTPGLYFIRCVDRYGRIASEKIIIGD